MNIVDYWKELVSGFQSAEDFGNEEDFVKKLDENVPDWKQQVKDKNLWPDLHSYSANIAETYYTDVIIRETGLEFAFYLIQTQWGKKHLDASLALDFCCEHINSWNTFPDYVKEKILAYHLREFLNRCLQNVDIWQSLTFVQKSSIFVNLALYEEKYVSDILLFKMWKSELNFKISPYIIFTTDHFRHIAQEIVHNNRDDFFEERIEHRLRGWDIPRVDLMPGEHLSYAPSEKLQLLKNVAEASGDTASLDTINSVTNNIQFQIHHYRLRE